jgi:PKHD-type hydroxylase
MQIQIDNVLNAHELAALQEALSERALFSDGADTAGRLAQSVKANQQGRPDAPEIKGAIRMIESALVKHPVFQAAAIPAAFARILVSRYEPGMEYGAHVDEAIIESIRTDLSFTLFLTPPDDYQGGALVLSRPCGEEAYKLPAGAAILYPSNTVHYVERITQGVRLAAAGWLQSRVRSAEQREILFDLRTALARLPQAAENLEARRLILKTRGSLMRLWAD